MRSIGRAAAIALLLSTNAYAVGVGNISNSVDAGADGTGVSALAWNHTVASGSNRELSVCVGATDDITGGIGTSSCTYAGTSMTKLRTDPSADGGGTDAQTDLFHIVNPTVGTNSISCTLNGANKIVIGGAIDFSGVNQSVPIDQAEPTGDGGTAGSAGTMTSTITTTNPNALHVACFQYKVDTGTPVLSSGTEAVNETLTDGTNSGDFTMAYTIVATPANSTLTYTGGPADDATVSGNAFQNGRRKVSVLG